MDAIFVILVLVGVVLVLFVVVGWLVVLGCAARSTILWAYRACKRMDAEDEARTEGIGLSR